MKGLAVVLVMLVLGATAVVATHPEVLQDLAVTPCSRYVLVSAHAAHPQRDNPGGVIGKIGYSFTYRPWGTVKYVKVLPNAADVKEVVFVLNKTGLMQYFSLFAEWKPKDIALIVNINNRGLAFEFAYLYPDGTIKGYSNKNVWIQGNEVHVKVFGWGRRPCDMNIAFEPAIEFYNGIAPVNWLGLPGAGAKLKCANCMVNPPGSSTVTEVPNAHVSAVAITSVTPWDPRAGEEFTVDYYVYLNYPADVPYHGTVVLAVDSKSNVVAREDITIPEGRDTYHGQFKLRLSTAGDHMLYVGINAYGSTIWSRAHGVTIVGITTTGVPALPTNVPEPQPTFTLPVVTSTPAQITAPTHSTVTHSNAQSTTAHKTSWLDRVRSAIQSLVDRIREWFSGFRWPW